MLRSPFLALTTVWLLVTGVLWVAVSTGIIVAPHGFRLITALIIAISIMAWGLGEAAARLMFCSLSSRGNATNQSSCATTTPINGRRGLVLLFLLAILSGTGYIVFLRTWGVIGILQSYSPVGTFSELNVEIAERTATFGGFVGRLYILSGLGLALTSYLLARGELSKRTAMFFGTAFLVMLVSPRRALLLQGGLLAVMVYAQSNRDKQQFRLIGLATAVVLAAFVGTQTLLGKTEANFTGIASSIVLYIGANIPTMDQLLHTSHFEQTHVTLNVFFRIINALFGSRYPTALDVPFTDVGVYSNTVPFQYYIYKDGGLLGVAVMSAALGFLAHVVNRTAALKNTFGMTWINAAFFVFIFFSFREFTLITYNWLFLLLIAMLISAFLHSGRPLDPARVV